MSRIPFVQRSLYQYHAKVSSGMSTNKPATICRWIAAQCQPLDDAITRTAEEIKLIREYRDRLIADVVTGQVDVRGWQPET